jgi:hypothetical protein
MKNVAPSHPPPNKVYKPIGSPDTQFVIAEGGRAVEVAGLLHTAHCASMEEKPKQIYIKKTRVIFYNFSLKSAFL